MPVDLYKTCLKVSYLYASYYIQWIFQFALILCCYATNLGKRIQIPSQKTSPHDVCTRPKSGTCSSILIVFSFSSYLFCVHLIYMYSLGCWFSFWIVPFRLRRGLLKLTFSVWLFSHLLVITVTYFCLHSRHWPLVDSFLNDNYLHIIILYILC